MKRIYDLLASISEISRFRITKTDRESYEMFFVHKKLETVRSSETTDINVTVYVDHDGSTGDSSFGIYRSMTDDDIISKASDAVARAKLVSNKPYGFPDAGTLDAKIATNLDATTHSELGAKIADAVFAADKIDSGSINAAEIFVYRDVTRVVNSEGMDKTQTKYHAMIEVIPTFTDDDESVELYFAHEFVNFDPDRITGEVAKKMEEVKNRKVAIKPEVPLCSDVLLHENEVWELMAQFASDLNYYNVYAKSNLHKKGDLIAENNGGDLITIDMVGSINGAVGSSYFDAEGTTLISTRIIEDGKVVGYYGSHRFAEYLGEIDTGDLGCMVLENGTLNDNDLACADYIECISLSGLQLDLYNDYIGGEIRLAYLHCGENVTPITGITMSGRLSEVLKTAKLSSKTITANRYSGPDKMLIKGMSIM